MPRSDPEIEQVLEESGPEYLFEDPQRVLLPSGLEAIEWKRCSEAFRGATFVVYVNRQTYPDLLAANRHLLRSEFYRTFIAALYYLPYLDKLWRPWYHVYSNCKVAKSQQEHRPTYNAIGKYVVRAHWMGTWRKLYVDDTVPLDKRRRILLPVLQDQGASSKPPDKWTFELWPVLLCKALLKLASLTLFDNFNVVQCLTGWIPQTIKAKDLSSTELWQLLMNNVEEYRWGQCNNVPRYVFVRCDEHQRFSDAGGPYYILASQVRTVPLTKPQPRPEIELWKTYRYEKWAMEKGILPPDVTKLNIQSLKIVDCFARNRLQPESQTHSYQKLQNGDQLQPDPSTWIDFHNLDVRIDHLVVYFEPRFFASKYKVSDINFSSKSSDFQYLLHDHRFKPVYVFTDSTDLKFLMLNLEQAGNLTVLEPQPRHVQEEQSELSLQVHAEPRDMCIEILMTKTSSPRQSTPASSIAQASEEGLNSAKCQANPISCLLEEYDWQSKGFGTIRARLRTVGSKSLGVTLEPGRKSFRMWVASRDSYVLQVFSDKPLRIGTLHGHLQACAQESERIIDFARLVSASFWRLVQSFGSPDHAASLRQFFDSYTPKTDIARLELIQIRDALVDELFETLTEIVSVDHLRLLLIRIKTFDGRRVRCGDHIDPTLLITDVQIGYARKMEEAAAKLQSYFKGVYVRRRVMLIRGRHKEYSAVAEQLRKTFSSVNLDIWIRIVRSFSEKMARNKLTRHFDVVEDLDHVLDVKEFKIAEQVGEEGWASICRYSLDVNSVQPVTINLFTNLPRSCVKVFDNDHLVAVARYNVEMFGTNVNGYTVLGYGRCEGVQTMNATLVVAATKKAARRATVAVRDTNPVSVHFRGNYIPNWEGLVCSNDVPEIRLRFRDAEGAVIGERAGAGAALLSLVACSTSGKYVIEANVVGESWSLTEDEWRNVSERRVDAKKPTTEGRKPDKLERPYYVLTIVYGSGDRLRFEDDRSKIATRHGMKKEWYENEPDRYERGMRSRDAYLKGHARESDEAEKRIGKLREINYEAADVDRIREEMNRWEREEKEQFEAVTHWFSAIRNESAAMLEQSRVLIDRYGNTTESLAKKKRDNGKKTKRL
ncbi:uncharacterized protein LOC132701700 isoform X3 [Cylas formicarius]|uniref:uncharacterized protein LOC132701700 isoform X3 n=1 Tax=Cylas formicarius TaxID=197179 RepID=UPI0029587F33|nr:uncharacterized protein LOC132701700 isoform X3 [Cylas formicarius]